MNAQQNKTVRPGDAAAPPKDLLVLRLLATLMTLTVSGLGILAILTTHYYGRTSKLGGAEVSIDGAPAVAMGLCLVFFGLLPLALWFRSKRPALVWMLLCLAASGLAFYFSIRLGQVT